MSATRSWIIDVCKTCDQLAQFPFCVHRMIGGNRWYESVTVYSRAKKVGR